MTDKDNTMWLPMKMEEDSAVDEFMYQLWNGKDICKGDWHGKWKGDHLNSCADPERAHWKFEPNGDFILQNKTFGWWDTAFNWVTRCTLNYDDGKVYFVASNDDGSKYLSAGCHVDWEQFCHVWNEGGVTPGWGCSDSDLPILMFDHDGWLEYDAEAHTLTFGHSLERTTLTEEQFVDRVVGASIWPFETNFKRCWIWLYCRQDGWMKKITSWPEFNNLIVDKTNVRVCEDRLHKGQEYDATQYEVKIELEDGSYLYGVQDVDNGDKFIRYYLHYRGDMEDDFQDPLPIYNCDVNVY